LANDRAPEENPRVSEPQGYSYEDQERHFQHYFRVLQWWGTPADLARIAKRAGNADRIETFFVEVEVYFEGRRRRAWLIRESLRFLRVLVATAVGLTALFGAATLLAKFLPVLP
jgi:hypothetical protein